MKEVVKKLWNSHRKLFVLIILECLLVLMLLPGIWQPNTSYQVFEGQVEMPLEIPLKPHDAGVLELRIDYYVPEGTATISVATRSKYHRSVYADEILLSAGGDSKEANVWLTSPAEDLYLSIQPETAMGLEIGCIEVTTTNAGTYMVILGLVVISVILDAFLVYRKRVVNSNATYGWLLWALCGIFIVVSLPLFTGYCLDGTELELQLLRIEQVKEELEAGHLWRSVQSDWCNGNRYPETLLDGNLFLLFPALLRIVGFPIQTSYCIFLAVINLGVIFISFESFYGIFKEQKTAFLGCMLYTWAPYRVYTMYGRASVNDTLVFCFWPLILYGLYRLFAGVREQKSSWVWLAVGLSCLLPCSMLNFEFAVVFVGLVCILQGKKCWCKQRLLALAKVCLTVLILNLWIMLPTVKMLIQDKLLILQQGMEAVQEKGLFMAHFFTFFWGKGESIAFHTTGIKDTAALGIGLGSLILLFLFSWMVFVGKYKEQRRTEEIWKWGYTVVIASIPFVILSTRYFPWDMLRETLNSVRVLTAGMYSPAECLVVVLLGSSFLGCMVYAQIQNHDRGAANVLFIIVVVASFWTTQYLVGELLYYGEALRIYDDVALEQACKMLVGWK